MTLWRLLEPLLVLPGVVVVAVPTLLVWLAGDLAWPPPLPNLVAGILLAAAGLALAHWTMRLFVTLGKGTPAPWDPPTRLVVRGPYAHVRNPMISAVLMMLPAEALLLQSWPIAIWWVVFAIGNMIYFPFSEEPGLEHRFGDDYRQYKANVPRWIPRLTPWSPGPDAANPKEQ